MGLSCALFETFFTISLKLFAYMFCYPILLQSLCWLIPIFSSNKLKTRILKLFSFVLFFMIFLVWSKIDVGLMKGTCVKHIFPCFMSTWKLLQAYVTRFFPIYPNLMPVLWLFSSCLIFNLCHSCYFNTMSSSSCIDIIHYFKDDFQSIPCNLESLFTY